MTSKSCDTGPVISVIMPYKGQAAATARAVVSILIGLQGMCKSQLVLVDDGATTDDSPSRKLAALLRNARVLWPHTAIVETKSGGIGRGYAPTVEAGLAVASGDFLLLVNNDIMVFPSALRVMRDTFRVRRRVGAERDSCASMERSRWREAQYSQTGVLCSSQTSGAQQIHSSGTRDLSTMDPLPA